MKSIAFFFMAAGMAVTVMILTIGIITMVRGQELNSKWGNKLMRMRVAAQAFALAMFGLGYYLMKSEG